jgi:hypothetical protein
LLTISSTQKAEEKLLYTYHDERITIALSLVKTTDRAFNFVTSEKAGARFIRLRVLPAALSLGVPIFERIKFLRQLAFRTISEIGIHYRKSDLSKQYPQSKFPKKAPKPGDRIPYIEDNGNASNFTINTVLPGVKFHLLLFSREKKSSELEDILKQVQNDYPDLIEINEILLSIQTQSIYKKFGIKENGYYLVRPDGYIAYRCNSLNFYNFFVYLRQYFTKKVNV